MTQIVGSPLKISPSKATRFRTCPKHYYFQDVERLPVEQRPSPQLAQGNAVHDALRLFYSIAPEDRSQQSIVAALKTVWRKHAKPEVFGNREAEAAYGRDAIDMLSRYFDGFDASTLALGLEDWVSTKIEGTEFYGKVDRAERRRIGDGLDVIDYKTGRRLLEPEDLRDEPSAQIYLLGGSETFKEPVVRIRFIYLRTGEEIAWTPEPEEVVEARERLAKLAREISSTTEFEAFPGPQCQFCPYASRCTDRHRLSLDALVGDRSLPF
ncbi:MAG: PD-(D/E)XK nuclease family protein [Actinobacteria bacterium]|nr:PD-(D/E)XK nuclease family protein [Actinomycetota bacterium]